MTDEQLRDGIHFAVTRLTEAAEYCDDAHSLISSWGEFAASRFPVGHYRGGLDVDACMAHDLEMFRERAAGLREAASRLEGMV